MEYKDFFSPQTLEKLNKKSAENLKTMLGDKNLMQTMVSSQQLLSQISKAEAPYKSQLEKLAVDMVKELYPIIDEEGIVLDAKIGDIGSVTSELDEIRVNRPGVRLKLRKISKDYGKLYTKDNTWYNNWKDWNNGSDGIPVNIYRNYIYLTPFEEDKINEFKTLLNSKGISSQIVTWHDIPRLKISNQYYDLVDQNSEQNLSEAISPESRRRIINSITQGAALRGAFAFYLFKEHLDEIDSSLVEKYNQIMKNSFGIYDDENAIAMMLSLLAQGQKMAGGSSKVILKEIKINKPGFGVLEPFLDEILPDYDDNLAPGTNYMLPEQIANLVYLRLPELKEKFNESQLKQHIINLINQRKPNITENSNPGITIKARAINFPMLVHELIKGLYELISLQGFKGSKEERQAVVDKVDLLKNEPSDIRYGKFIFDALNEVFANSGYNDPRIREFFFAEVYQLNDDEFISFIENAVNEELTSTQQSWIKNTLRDIDADLRADDFDSTGLDEIKVNNPSLSYEDILKYLKDYILNDKISNKSAKFYSILGKYGYRAGDKTKDFINKLSGPNRLLLKTDLENLKEIKVNNPYRKAKLTTGDEDEVIVLRANIPYETVKDKVDDDVDFFDGDRTEVTWNLIRFKDGEEHWWSSDELEFIKEIKSPISSQKKIFESFDQKIISLITEYSEKTINTTIERWKKENPKTDENLAKQLIQRFDQIKSGLAQKLDIIVLPDALKQGNNYLNIDKYSYDDMIKLIKSLPENPEKVKKDAIERFVKNEQIDKATAQSYVSRFIANKDKLKYAVENGTEDESFTKEEVKELIPKNLLNNNAYLDPRVWKWQSFEQLIDALFPSQKKASEGEENLVSTDADKIYSGNGIEIYKGDDVHKCISYNPVIDKRKKYGWCVTQVGNTNYDYYRFGDKAPTFYFIFDRTRSSAPNHSPFDDQWHAFVIQVTADAKTYIITGADNRGDKPVDGWENVSKVVPSETWAKIKDLKDYFKPIALSAVERGRKFASGKDLSLDEFKELSQDEKILYVQGKASKNQISKNILQILPQYKINLEGRSTTLANVAIDSGQKFSYDDLKDNEPLAKRYAAFRFRHTNYGKEPIPLSFVKYLDEESKQKYLNTFDDNLTFEYIEKFFGDKVAEKYVEKQLKKLDYLPPSAVKYIKNPKLKQLFETYSKLFSSWQFSANTNISEKELENMATMPEQSVNPVPINQKQWSSFSNSERKSIIELAEKFNQDLKYATLLYALPYVIKDGDMKYVLVPKSNQDFQYDSWVIMDEQGKVIKDNISGDSTLGNIPLYNGYPDESTDYNRIYNINDLKTNKK